MIARDNRIEGWLAISFFGLGIPISIKLLLDRRPKLLINDRGISDRRFPFGTIPWEHIESVSLKAIQQQHFLCLHLKNESTYVEKLSGMQQKFVDLNRKLGFPPISIGMGELNVDPTEVKGLVDRYIAVRNRAKLG